MTFLPNERQYECCIKSLLYYLNHLNQSNNELTEFDWDSLK